MLFLISEMQWLLVLHPWDSPQSVTGCHVDLLLPTALSVAAKRLDIWDGFKGCMMFSFVLAA
jgi:hypothetical protein